ncbi:MAG: hypothetical protein JXO22_08605 [Phycisphaerae bacterium]|nr:hypothetical protein [Phycisphaerae bacterium]
MLIGNAWQTLFQTPQLGLVVGLLIACVIPVAGIVGHYWYMAQKSRAENGL